MTWLEDERRWIETFQKTVVAKHAETVKEIIVFGSKARGDWNEDSDIDVLLIVDGERQRIREVIDCGHDLAAGSQAVPIIIARTRAAWDKLRKLRTAFYQAIEHDGVRIV